jgi:hypothetical protein
LGICDWKVEISIQQSAFTIQSSTVVQLPKIKDNTKGIAPRLRCASLGVTAVKRDIPNICH